MPEPTPDTIWHEKHRRHLLWLALNSGLVAVVAHLATWIPFFVARNQSLGNVAEVQRRTPDPHPNVSPDAGSCSRWWSWPLDPIPSGSAPERSVKRQPHGSYAFVNPLVSWGILPAVAKDRPLRAMDLTGWMK